MIKKRESGLIEINLSTALVVYLVVGLGFISIFCFYVLSYRAQQISYFVSSYISDSDETEFNTDVDRVRSFIKKDIGDTYLISMTISKYEYLNGVYRLIKKHESGTDEVSCSEIKANELPKLSSINTSFSIARVCMQYKTLKLTSNSLSFFISAN